MRKEIGCLQDPKNESPYDNQFSRKSNLDGLHHEDGKDDYDKLSQDIDWGSCSPERQLDSLRSVTDYSSEQLDWTYYIDTFPRCCIPRPRSATSE